MSQTLIGRISTVILMSCIMLLVSSCMTDSFDESGETIVNGSVYKGAYIYGHEVNSFQPCGSEKEYWVIGDNDVLQGLSEGYSEKSHKAYTPVYVTVNGELMGKATDGFAADYDGQLKVSYVQYLGAENNCE